VLTNQCLEKKQKLSEELRNPSFLMDSVKLIVERRRDICACGSTMLALHHPSS
jgi:hypothetical protein